MTAWLQVWWVLFHGIFGQNILLPIISGPKQASCTTPTGSHFTESFGDSSTLCWTAGPSSCNHTWTIGSGSIQSIIASPGTPPANTACANSLQLAIATGSNDYISSNFTGIPAATNYDVTGTVYVSSGMNMAAVNVFLCMTASAGDCDISGGTIIALGLYSPDGSTQQLIGIGTGFSGATTISTSAWHTFDLHHDSTAANCSIAVDGGTPSTFTCNVATAGTIYMGIEHYSPQATTIAVGNVAF